MKHFDKQLEMNINLREPKRQKNVKKNTLEGINIIILIGLGITGLFFYTNTLYPSNASKSSNDISNNTTFYNNDKSAVAAKKMSPEKLIVEGHREAGENIKITITNFNKKSTYRIKFGDGVSKEITNRKTYHTYKSSGDYNIQLLIDNGQKQHRINKKIQIEPAIEVMEEAYQEE